ncbi:MFS transporter [Kribbella shirazensis]|uniref:MFS family permease n=1 Tax=Kribbella shirazensis TaxID=1105143 RepID=A0A7X5VCW5_9ACTN|nr:MFS transporter [Kribbella shirazensis]NIK58858.1 MFS family permease [Kribbella shirazensis]
MTAERVLRTYLTLVAVSTGASSLIWGVNTLFLLDAGLSIGETFAANAFFTVGMVLFEVPTGVVADTLGRRTSYLLGTATLVGTTLLYLLLWQIHAPFVWWAIVSALLGLGFTFFSGATEAWLVDGLHATGYRGSLDAAFAKGQVVNGIAMMAGSIGGGILAQLTNLGLPYVARSVLLVATFVVAWRAMHDLGFTPKPDASVRREMTGIVRASLRHGLLNPRVRWVMLAGPFTAGVSVYGFYAAHPYLLELYGNADSYAIAGLSAGIVAGAQIAGGTSAPYLARVFRDRMRMLIAAIVVSGLMIVAIGLVTSFWVALALLMVWGSMYAAMSPVRQAYLNSHIPSAQRATVLSFDNLLGSAGGVVVQPALGRTADIWGYGPAYLVSAVIQTLAVPFLGLARRTGKSVEDTAAQPLALRA